MKTTSSKLSSLQKEVLSLMSQGWELSQTIGLNEGRCSLQEGGIGRGGKVIDIRATTVYKLEKEGYIEFIEKFPNRIYKLTQIEGDK